MRILCRLPWRWCHDLSWPVRKIQTCSQCGAQFESKLFGLTEQEEFNRLKRYKLDSGDAE